MIFFLFWGQEGVPGPPSPPPVGPLVCTDVRGPYPMKVKPLGVWVFGTAPVCSRNHAAYTAQLQGIGKAVSSRKRLG